MKAIAKTRPGFGAELIDVPIPHPASGELLIRVAACGICGSDLHIYEWELNADRMAGRLPFVLGHEPAGEVIETGPKVVGFKAGDKVALDPFGQCGRCSACLGGRFHLCVEQSHLSGAFAEFTIAPAANAHLVPPQMDFEQAALLEPFCTGLHAVEQSCLKLGDSAVIEGPGPIGLSAAIACRALGVANIVITGLAADTERLRLAQKMGFTTVCAAERGWIEQVRALMPAGGADVLFDAAGAMDSARQLLRRGGQMIELGWPARDVTGEELRALFFHGVTVINSRIRSPESWRRGIALVASGAVDLTPMITHRVPLSRGLEAFELLRAKQGVKVLVKPQ